MLLSNCKIPRSIVHKLSKHKCFICITVVVVTLALVHLYLIPSFTESYNRDCYLDTKSLNAIKYMLTNIIEVFDKHEVFYWLDYGTLLGAERYKSIIPWDGDGDVSFLRDDDNIHTALHELGTRGIEANTMIAEYNGMTIDFMRWYKEEGFYQGEKQTMLYKYYPPWVQDNIITKLNHRLETFPMTWIGKRKKLQFLSKTASVPEYHLKLLKYRYKWTSSFSMPYKWKCYWPCFLYNSDPSCTQV